MLFINDLDSATNFFTILFADDTTLQLADSNLENLFLNSNKELEKAAIWFQSNKLTLNIKKTKFILFRKKNMKVDFTKYSLKIGQDAIDRIGHGCKETSFKFVGHVIDEFLEWNDHIKHVVTKLSKGNYIIAKSKNMVPLKIRKSLYSSLFQSHLEFGLISWGSAACSKLKPIINLQKKCIRNVKNTNYRAHTNPIFKELEIVKFEDLLLTNKVKFMHSYYSEMAPDSFAGMFDLLSEIGIRNTRNNEITFNYVENEPKCAFLKKLPKTTLPKAWNTLPLYLKKSETKYLFNKQLKEFCLDKYPDGVKCEEISCPSCFNQLWVKSGLLSIKKPFFIDWRER